MDMRVTKWLIGVMAVGLCLSTGSAFATYSNATSSDGDGSGTGWYGATNEDQEVMPNCVTTQVWDMEAFLQDGQQMMMVGGYNLQAGQLASGWNPHNANGNPNFLAGDIFFDTNELLSHVDPTNPPEYVNNPVVNNSFGYEYVMDINWNDVYGAPGATTLQYQVYRLSSASALTLTDVYFNQNNSANPWRYVSGGTQVGQGNITLATVTSPNYIIDTGNNTTLTLTGGTHYTASWDMSSWIDDIVAYDSNGPLDLTVHFTQQCGNDNLMGTLQGDSVLTPPNVVPEPTTILLMGLSLMGLAARRQAMRFF